MKVKDVIAEYTQSHGYRALKPSSKSQYTSSLDRLNKEFGDRAIGGIKRSDLLRLTSRMGNTPGMANRLSRVASVLFTFALDMGYIESSPAIRLKKMRMGTIEKWTPGEVFQIIKLSAPVISIAVALGWFTGQRESDILQMKWSDLSADGTTLRVRQKKTGKHMEIYVHPHLRKMLGKTQHDGPYIVGRKISTSAFRMMFKRRVEEAGVYKTFHGIRKGVASYLAESGLSTNGIAKLLGHETLSMADLYTRQAHATGMIKEAVKSIPAPKER